MKAFNFITQDERSSHSSSNLLRLNEHATKSILHTTIAFNFLRDNRIMSTKQSRRVSEIPLYMTFFSFSSFSTISTLK